MDTSQNKRSSREMVALSGPTPVRCGIWTGRRGHGSLMRRSYSRLLDGDARQLDFDDVLPALIIEISERGDPDHQQGDDNIASVGHSKNLSLAARWLRLSLAAITTNGGHDHKSRHHRK
jgi:hypothetical protein